MDLSDLCKNPFNAVVAVAEMASNNHVSCSFHS